jgi:hypothetical protein
MRIDFTPDPALYPFTSRWFDSSRGRVHYVDEGSGPAFSDHVLVELPDANRYIQEDAPERITEAFIDRFG